jgi:F-type H+-transporting ATPase subunit b
MEKLGVEPKLLLAQIINFGIIIFVLTKFLYKPILEMLEKRRLEIKKGLDLTQKMTDEEMKYNEKKAKMLDQTRKEVRKILDDATAQGHDKEKEIIEDAHKEAAVIIEKAKVEAEKLKQELLDNSKRESVELAVAMAKRITSSILDENSQHKLIRQHLKDLEK